MKREILFKGKRVDNGEWVEGNYSKMNGESDILVSRHGNFENWKYEKSNIDVHLISVFEMPNSSGWHYNSQCTFIEVYPETVCQFTGLLDKNGNKIFEGDKVKFKNFRGFNGVKISKYDGWIEGFEGVIHWSNQFGWFLNKDNAHNSKILEAKGKETESRKCNLVITNSNICAFEVEVIGNIYTEK